MATIVNPALRIVRALDDPVRYAIVRRLIAGPATVSDLIAEVAASQPKVSNHLAILRAGGIVADERLGRTVAYSLAGAHVAAVVEALEAAAGDGAHVARAVPEIALARRCYDHLAGRLGVAVFASLVAHGALAAPPADRHARKVRSGLGPIALGPRALPVFGSLDIDLDALQTVRRQFATACNDWTESEPHLAGALGAALQHALLQRGWLLRRSGTRALRITPRGRDELAHRFGQRVRSVLAQP